MQCMSLCLAVRGEKGQSGAAEGIWDESLSIVCGIRMNIIFMLHKGVLVSLHWFTGIFDISTVYM